MWGSFGLIGDDVFFLQEGNPLEVIGERAEEMRIRTGVVERSSIVGRAVVGVAQLSSEQLPLVLSLVRAG
jgi:hypothetical protein